MTTAVAIREEETPRERVELCLQMFTILFCEFFTTPRPRYITRAVHVKACDFMRGLEAVVRRMMIMLAITLLPGLPSPQPANAAAPARPKAVTPKPTPTTDRPDCFVVFRPPPRPPTAPAAGQHGRRVDPSAEVDLQLIGRRFNAVLNAFNDADACARRVALRLQALHARGLRVRCAREPTLAEEHARYLEVHIRLLTVDANVQLSALWPDSS